MEAFRKKYKVYEEYKDFVCDWEKKIPFQWKVVSLKLLADIRGRIGFRGYTVNDLVSEGEGALTLGAKHISKNNEIDLSEPEFISWEKYYESPEIIIAPHDLIFVQRGSIGKFAYVQNEIGKATINPSLLLLKDIKCLPKFLYYSLYAKHVQVEIAVVTTSTAVPMVSQEQVKNFKIFIPSFKEQQKIATFLDRETIKLDKLVEMKEQLIELLKEKRQAIITQAVTKGIDRNAPMKNSGIEWLGVVPNHWKVSKLGYEYRVKARLGWKGLKASEYVDDGYIFLSTPNIKDHEIDFKNVNYITEARYLESPEIMLEPGDVLLAKDGSTLGIANVIRELPSPATVNSSIAVLRARKKAHSIYLYYFLRSNYMQHIIQRFKDGMGVPHLFQRDINKFDILVPPFEEQKRIADYLDKQTLNINNVIDKLNEQITKIKEYRQSLISAAVTGKIDVRDEV